MADEVQVPACQGEHNAEVLSELGFSPAEIKELEAVGALVQPAAAPDPGTPHDGLS
jgi:hypothetical protein